MYSVFFSLILDYIKPGLFYFQSEDKSIDQSDDQEEDSESLFNIEETNLEFDHVDKHDFKIEHDGESDDDSTVEIGESKFLLIFISKIS